MGISRDLGICILVITELSACAQHKALLLVGCVPFNIQLDSDQRYLTQEEKHLLFKKQYTYERALTTILWHYPALPSVDNQLSQLRSDVMFSSVDALENIFCQRTETGIPGYADWRRQQWLREKKYNCATMCAKQFAVGLLLFVGYWIATT